MRAVYPHYAIISDGATGIEVLCPLENVEDKRLLVRGAYITYELTMSNTGRNMAKAVRLP